MGMLSLKHWDDYSIFFVGGDVLAGEVPKFVVCGLRYWQTGETIDISKRENLEKYYSNLSL